MKSLWNMGSPPVSVKARIPQAAASSISRIASAG